jgi:hypothetical protein
MPRYDLKPKKLFQEEIRALEDAEAAEEAETEREEMDVTQPEPTHSTSAMETPRATRYRALTPPPTQKKDRVKARESVGLSSASAVGATSSDIEANADGASETETMVSNASVPSMRDWPRKKKRPASDGSISGKAKMMSLEAEGGSETVGHVSKKQRSGETFSQ